MHIVEHGDQPVVHMLDARGMRAVVQRFIERVGQTGMLAQPALAAVVREVEMQPQEGARRLLGAGLQPGQ